MSAGSRRPHPRAARRSGFQCDVSSDSEIDHPLRHPQGEVRQARHPRPRRRLCPRRGPPRRIPQHQPRRLPHRHDVSVYSLIAVTRAAAPLMTEGGSIMTLTYYAAEKVVPNYNVMALAKAALEARSAISPGTSASRHPRQRHLRRPHQDAGGPRHRRLERHAQGPRRSRPAPSQRRPG